MKDGHGHKKGWREAADRLKKVYGLQLSPANSAEELSVPRSLSQEPAIRYVFRCADCGQIIQRSRRSKFVENPERYRCGNCGGTLEQRYGELVILGHSDIQQASVDPGPAFPRAKFFTVRPD